MKKIFVRCMHHKLRMNPLRCPFRVSFETFLEFTTHKKRIDLDLAKVRLSKLRILPLVVSNLIFSCGERPMFIKSTIDQTNRAFPQVAQEECPIPIEQAIAISFEKVKDVFSLPLTMISPIKDLLLIPILTSINKSTGAFLEEEVDGIEYLVYYWSKSL